MSIWSSIQGPDVKATPDDDYPDNPRATVDVATATPWHNGIRLAIWGSGNSMVVLDPENARLLVSHLTEALRQVSEEHDEAAPSVASDHGSVELIEAEFVQGHHVTTLTAAASTSYFIGCVCGWLDTAPIGLVPKVWQEHRDG